MKNVSKDMVVDKIASKTGMSKKDVAEVLMHFQEVIMKEVASGKKVTFTGFGIFQPVKRKARTGVNPATGAKIKIPARTAPKFKAGKKFVDLVR